MNHQPEPCVYFEVDSFLPVCGQFEFLRKSCYRNDAYMGEGFRLKTIRFRGQISQGLILPLSILPEGREYQIGDDVSEVLGIRKWEVADKVTSSGLQSERCRLEYPKQMRCGCSLSRS